MTCLDLNNPNMVLILLIILVFMVLMILCLNITAMGLILNLLIRYYCQNYRRFTVLV